MSAKNSNGSLEMKSLLNDEEKEPITMSDDAIVSPLHNHECDHCGEKHEHNSHNTPSTTSTTTSAPTTTSPTTPTTTEPEKGSSYIPSILTGLLVGIGCLACHHIACPLITLKAGAVGAKYAATKGTIHHLLARATGGQCCCCSCSGCNGCCPCGTSCCCSCGC